jgi:hypothetical protein
MALPMLQEVIALVGCGKAIDQFQRAPVRFRAGHVVKGLNAREVSIGAARNATAGRQGSYGDDVHGQRRDPLTTPSFAKISQQTVGILS